MAGEQRWARCVWQRLRAPPVHVLCSFSGGGGSLWICVLLMMNLILCWSASNVSAELSHDGQLLLNFTEANRDSLRQCLDFASWNASEDTPCGWIRVFCTAESAVHRLDLSACSVGFLKLDMLSGLGSLQELDLSSNPDSNVGAWGLGALTGLTWLDVSGLDLLTFSGVVTLRNLRHLNAEMEYNPFNYGLPSLGELLQLVALSFAESGLGGSIPEEVRNLKELVSLDLSHNVLQGSVPNLEGLTRLVHLSLTSNNLSGEVPFAPYMHFLHAAQNCFTNLTPSFFQISALKQVNLSRNQLWAPLQEFKFPSLELLDMSCNYLYGHIPSGLGKVMHLDLSYNNLSGPIPPDIRVGNHKRQRGWVNLCGNELNGSLPASLLYGALYVNLSRNSLAGNIPDVPLAPGHVVPYLLDLSDNQLDGPLPSALISNSAGFHALWLHNNHFSGDLILLFNQWPLVRAASFRVQGNNFTGDLTRLLGSWGLQHYPTTRVLDLSHNNFNMIPSEKFLNPLRTMLEMFCNISDPLDDGFSLEELRLAGGDLMGQQLPISLDCGIRMRDPMLHKDIRIMGLDNLKVLDLASCNLSGRVSEPLFNIGMPNLTFLNVSNNRLSGPIPERLPFTLSVLDLSNNNLEGEMPAELFATGLPSLLYFNACNNNLSGSIPQTFPLTLQVLDLSHNNLTGQIPDKLFYRSPNLRYINLSNNNLSGPIPDGLPLALYNASFFTDNPGLCGRPLGSCIASQPPGQGAGGMDVWVLVTVLVTAVLVCTGSCLVLFWRWTAYSKRHQQDADLIATLLERETVTVMPLRELRRATSNFSESAQIGVGGFGTVYTGKLVDGTAVAIKKSKREGSPQYKQQFLNEVKILSGVNHRHLVKLLGCSMENRIALLVFEFVPNGTLKEHLQRKRQGIPPLSWRQRLLIALQTSDALAYLHSAADPPIFHRDVKSLNILLDHDLNAKVADFGISKLAPSKATTHVSTGAVQGTMGYIDPEYYASFQLTPKSDVYSFGVVLLELISAKPAVDFGRGYDETSLASLALSAMDRGAWEELIDPVLADTYSSPNGKASIGFVGALAVRCLASRSRERPQMKEVWKDLQTVWLHWDSDASFQWDFVRHYLQPQTACPNVYASYDSMSPQTPHASPCSTSSTPGPQVEIATSLRFQHSRSNSL